METNIVYQEDCIEGMKKIPDNSIDLVLTDPPYGITACEWDKPVDLKKWWVEIKRIIKPNTAVIITASQPFTTDLINSNREMFKYELIWDKNSSTGGFLNASKKPIQVHEEILIFSKAGCTTGSKPLMFYNPIMEKRDKPRKSIAYNKSNQPKMTNLEGREKSFKILTHKYPKSIVRISNADKRNISHPTQKPVELFKYLIKTYSKENQLILDCFAGSGTTAVACMQTNRKYILFETNPQYIKIINKRLAQSTVSDFTSKSKILTSPKEKGFNEGLEVQKSEISSPKLSPTEITSPNPNIISNLNGGLQAGCNSTLMNCSTKLGEVK